MKVLHFALSTLGYGETLMGLSLADQLRDAGVESHFVIAPISETVAKRSGHRYTVIDAAMGGLVRLVLDDVVATFRPDLIMLDDYWTYCGMFERQFGFDPWFVDGYGVPVVPIDIWEWARTDFTIDMYGTLGFDVSRRILDMDAVLRPVPVAHLDDPGDPAAFGYRLWGEDERVSRRTREHLGTTFGMGRGDRLVLLTFAAWQQRPPESSRADLARMTAAVPELLRSYLDDLPDSTHFMVVGSVPDALQTLPADRLHAVPPCSMKRFSTLLGSADLVLSLNAGATTVARAVLSDIPALVLTNQFSIDDEPARQAAAAALGGLHDDVERWLPTATPLYPFRMWPLGFHSFLGPVLDANPYTDALAWAELLDRETAVTTMTSLLYDRATIDAQAQSRAAYRKLVDDLPSTPEVFGAAVARVGLTL